MVDIDEWRCIFFIFFSLKKKKKSFKKLINYLFINYIFIYEIKNLYKYMLKIYILIIIYKKKFILNGMILFNLYIVFIVYFLVKL